MVIVLFFFPLLTSQVPHLNRVVFSYQMRVSGQSMSCGVDCVCLPWSISVVFFPFLFLLKGLMGPEGKDGPPGLQGLRVSKPCFFPGVPTQPHHTPHFSCSHRGDSAGLLSLRWMLEADWRVSWVWQWLRMGSLELGPGLSPADECVVSLCMLRQEKKRVQVSIIWSVDICLEFLKAWKPYE